jgi:hypothetical protein
MSSLAMCQRLSGIWQRLATTLRRAPARRRDAAVLRVMANLLLEEHARLCSSPADEMTAPHDSGTFEQEGAIKASNSDGVALIQMRVPWSLCSHINVVRRWARYVFLGEWSLGDERMAQIIVLANLLERQWHIKRLVIQKKRHPMHSDSKRAPTGR